MELSFVFTVGNCFTESFYDVSIYSQMDFELHCRFDLFFFNARVCGKTQFLIYKLCV